MIFGNFPFRQILTAVLVSLTSSALAQDRPEITVLSSESSDLSSPTFRINPTDLRVRHRLSGLDNHWTEPSDEMNFTIRFILPNGNEANRITFPVTKQSADWTGDPNNSPFSTQEHKIPIPKDVRKIALSMSSSGAPASVGVYAIRSLNLSTVQGKKAFPIFIDGLQAEPSINKWNRSGTRHSIAHKGPNFPVELRLIDNDIKAHADWSFSSPIKGDHILIKWEEAYSIGKGGPRPVTYERLPPGDYLLEIEELNIQGEPLGTISYLKHIVPRPFWKTWWFWTLCLAVIATTVLLFIRSAVKRRVRRAVRHTRLLENERLRIAMDLHDDIGTRLSQISLIVSHARMKGSDPESGKSLLQITQLIGELANSLSETVWMLSPKNNDLESLIGFLCRIASDLCRVGEMRCRIDADDIEDDIQISQEFRHHFVLSVKEALNNTLKHSKAEEVRLQIKLHDKKLKIMISDDGIGSQQKPITLGNGLESMKRRMTELNGTFFREDDASGGFQIHLSAPLQQEKY